MWSDFVAVIADLMVAVGDVVGGSLGLGIFLTTLVARLALIPLSLPLAVRTRDRQAIVRKIKPEIKALDREYRDDPGVLQRKLDDLHHRHGIKVVDWPGVAGALLQVPILIAFFQAVFVVIADTPLESGGIAWGILAAALAMYGVYAGGQAEDNRWMLWLSGILPVGITVWLGSGIALYLTAFYAGGALQATLMPRSRGEPEELG